MAKDDVLSDLELKALEILKENFKSKIEMSSAEIMKESGGVFKKTNLYTTLSRLEENGYVSSRFEQDSLVSYILPKKYYKITENGFLVLTIRKAFLVAKQSHPIEFAELSGVVMLLGSEILEPGNFGSFLIWNSEKQEPMMCVTFKNIGQEKGQIILELVNIKR